MNSENNNWARMCDACRSAACTVYCRTDLAYLCTGCDSRIHAAADGVVLRHERVRVCDACERAPAALFCKADAASLCATCDAEIHSANPLAQRHHRVPIIPIPADCLPGMGMRMEMGSTPNAIDSDFLTEDVNDSVTNEEDEDEAASWLLLNPDKGNHKHSNINGFEFGGGVVDEYLDLIDYNNYSNSDPQFSDDYTNQQHSATQNSFVSDSVVPVQSTEAKDDQLQLKQLNQSFHLTIDHETSKAGYNHHASIGHTVTISSMDVGIVPESTVSDGSISHPIAPKATIDLFSSPPFQMPTHQLASMDREARVLRYREKKKARRFEKTIRYASRKAYAETRPRIKGRFARRTDVEVEVDVDQMFSTSLMPESGYGIVPSF